MKYIVDVRNKLLHRYMLNLKTGEYVLKDKIKLTRTELKFILNLRNDGFVRLQDLALIMYGSTDKCACGCVRLVKSRMMKKTSVRITTKFGYGYKLNNEVEIC